MGALMGGLMSNHQNQINLDLIEIIQLWTFWTFYWTFYLNHLSPLWGYFYISCHVQFSFCTLCTQNAHCQCHLDVVHTCTHHRETWLVNDIHHPHVIHMSSAGGYIIHTLFAILYDLYSIIAHSLHKRILSMPCRCCLHMYT